MNDHSKPSIVVPATIDSKERRVLREETFEVIENATPKDIIALTGRMAKLLNHYVADVLQSGMLTCAHPASNGMANASSTLEQAAFAYHQILLQQQQGAFAGPGGPQPMVGGPFRTN